MASEPRLSAQPSSDNGGVQRVALDLTLAMLDASPERQDEILALFARCLLTVQDPQRGLDDIKRAVRRATGGSDRMPMPGQGSADHGPSASRSFT